MSAPGTRINPVPIESASRIRLQRCVLSSPRNLASEQQPIQLHWHTALKRSPYTYACDLGELGGSQPCGEVYTVVRLLSHNRGGNATASCGDAASERLPTAFPFKVITLDLSREERL